MSMLDTVREALDNVNRAVQVTGCAQVLTNVQRELLFEQLERSLDNLDTLAEQYPSRDQGLIDAAFADVQAAHTYAMEARAVSGGYCLTHDVDGLLRDAIELVEQFLAGSTGTGTGTGSGTSGGSGSSGTGKEPRTGGSSGTRPSLTAPPSSFLTILGWGLLSGAAVVGIVALAKRR
jgi:hypothetical protein